MKRLISLCTAVVLIMIAALSSSAFTLQSSRTYQSADDTGAYTITFGGRHADISRYTSRTFSVGLDLSYPVSGVCACRGKVLLFCDDSANNQLIVYVYDLNTDALDNFAIYGAKLYNNTDFCCGDDRVYMENHRDSAELLVYSFSGSLITRCRLNGEITALFSGYHSGVYAVTSSGLCRITGNSAAEIPGDDVSPPLFPVSDGCIASAYGKVYTLNTNRVAYAFSVDTDYRAASACVIGDRLYYPCGSVINGYDRNTGEKVCYYRLSFDTTLLYADADSIIAVGGSSCTAVDTVAFVELKQPEPVAEEEKTENQNGGGHSVNGGSEPSVISSSQYKVNFDRYWITGISPATTVAQFKSHMNYSGWSVAIYRGGSQKTSGNVGTGMTAVFTAGSSSITFELSVEGDVTGEGNRNSRDLNLLMDYLIGSADFNGVYTVSADVNSDGKVNIADAAELKSII